MIGVLSECFVNLFGDALSNLQAVREFGLVGVVCTSDRLA